MPAKILLAVVAVLGLFTDRLLFLLLAAGLATLWWWYRRENDRLDKMRLAGTAALASLLFLAVTPATPWVSVSDPRNERVECLLGEERTCATYAVVTARQQETCFAQAPRTSLAEKYFELQRWEIASASVRLGLVFTMTLLLPSLIWLIVAPGCRAAQGAILGGASMAAFTLLSILFFHMSVPVWAKAELLWPSELALVATTNIVVAILLIAKQAFATEPSSRLPAATARPSATPRRGWRI